MLLLLLRLLLLVFSTAASLPATPAAPVTSSTVPSIVEAGTTSATAAAITAATLILTAVAMRVWLVRPALRIAWLISPSRSPCPSARAAGPTAAVGYPPPFGAGCDDSPLE